MINYKLLNGDMESQLLSVSLHKMLFKIRKDNKIARSLLKINQLGYTKESIRNVTLRKDKVMSFCPKGKETLICEDNPDKWSRQNRQQATKYGKILRRVIEQQIPKLKYCNKDLEDLVNLLKAEVSDGNFSEVSGEDIAHWYVGVDYAEKSGSLSGSCMRDVPKNWLDIYSKNEDVVKMVILSKNGELVGRALVWENKWMDRIYGSDHTIQMFKGYAKEKGWNHKLRQCYEDQRNWVSSSGKEFQQKVTVNLKTDFSNYPFVDTMCYMSDGEITNEKSSGFKTMQSTSGCLSDEDDDNRTYDDWDDCYIDNDDAVYIENREIYTHHSNASYDDIWCEHIISVDAVAVYYNGSDQTTHQDNDSIVYCEEDSMYCHIDEATQCGHDDEWYISDNHDFEEINGETIHEDNVESYRESIKTK